MNTLALAGLAEQGIFYGLLIAWAWLGLVALLVGVAVYRRSWFVFGWAAALLILFTVMTAPWQFLVVMPDPDRDVVFWDKASQVAAFGWIGVCAIAVGGMIVLACRTQSRKRSWHTVYNPHPSPLPAYRARE